MGWGEGVHPYSLEGPIKKEGDGKSPAGLFLLGMAFGFQKLEECAFLKILYLHLSESVEAVDDSRSVYYNQIVDKNSVAADWVSSEKMALVPLYKWGIEILQNQKALPYRGSAVFLHIWSGPSLGTAGCTAMAEADLEKLLNWLNSKHSPYILQLPKNEYNKYRERWNLPLINRK